MRDLARSPATRGQARDGFVLIEMLVAMAIGAFLLVALASVTAFLLRTHDRIMTEAQEAEDAGRALAALSRDIRLAAHVRWAGRDGGLVFSGSSDRLMLAGAFPMANGFDGTTAVLIQVRGLKEGTQLLRTETSLPPGAGAADMLTWGPPASLYSGSFRIAFAYFMRLETGGEALLDEWPPGDEMPVAVRISFLPSGPPTRSHGQPLSMRVPLLADTEPACAVPDAPGCDKAEEADVPEAGDTAPAAPVDADDTLGWSRYAR